VISSSQEKAEDKKIVKQIKEKMQRRNKELSR
jgi:hypothetical protein